MKLHNKLFLLALVSFSTVLMPTGSVLTNALDCVESGTVKEEMEKSDVIFTGKVVSSKDNKRNNDMQSINVDFDVYQIWKGEKTETITIQDIPGWAYFTVGEEYLVYAKDSEGELHSSVCTRSSVLEDAEADLVELGKPIAILKETPIQKEPAAIATTSQTDSLKNDLQKAAISNEETIHKSYIYGQFMVFIPLFLSILGAGGYMLSREKRKEKDEIHGTFFIESTNKEKRK